MKKMLLVLMVLTSMKIYSQNILNTSGNVIYTVDSVTGEIKNINFDVVGTISETGIIYNELQTPIAYFSENNELITNQGDSLGKLNEDGSVQFKNGAQIGYIQNDGIVLGSNQNTIGNGNDVAKRFLMYLFFFYPL
ncbi:MAG: hypothetical protein CMD31_12915 [Flavobacteriales bacterium]|jgi:hypothetical protein|nr:hypothetical protein [Flavobacteriales bacterium]|tara:strand:+ start:25595 stop:26002 length:408 start_codon:yes stop_codon:yes gene_type:complete